MPADRTLGNYVLGAMLGRGGTGEVYAAEHRFLGDRVAIKLLRAHIAGDPAAMQAFLDEATRTRSIAHPGVVRVLDFGVDGDDGYLVMERLDGETLAAHLQRVGRLDEPELRRLGAAIADGVAAAHARGIVHRDLKPGNIVLVGGAPKIVDFGIARPFHRAAATITGSRLGTLAYMAPEQIAGGLVAPSVDVWALGAILYEALTGQLPFENFSGGRMPQLLDTPPRPGTLAAASPALEALIESCLAREPAHRPASMQAIADALRAAPGDVRITEDLPPSDDPQRHAERPPPSPARDPQPTARRSRWIAGAAAATIALFAIAWNFAARDAPKPSTPSIGAPASTRTNETRTAVDTKTAAETGTAAETKPAAKPKSVTDTKSAGEAKPAAGAQAPEAGFVVEVRSAPAGAGIVVAGKRVGVTPASIALAAPASIVVTHAGYRPSRIRAERAGSIDVRLVPLRRAPVRRPAAGETLD